jgi:hypothetical protein
MRFEGARISPLTACGEDATAIVESGATPTTRCAAGAAESPP